MYDTQLISWVFTTEEIVVNHTFNLPPQSPTFKNTQCKHLPFRPCLLPDVLYYTLSTDDKKKALFAEQGASDWELFLLHRCRELVPGKKLNRLINACKHE